MALPSRSSARYTMFARHDENSPNSGADTENSPPWVLTGRSEGVCSQ